MQNRSDDLDLSALGNVTAEAVVVGCSHNNPDCQHLIHPSEAHFFTIDIDSKIKPDLCFDVVRNGAPDQLTHKFKLTILENLPCEAYNHSDVWTRLTGKSGQQGLDNICKMTREDGFIMIVGSPRDIRFRQSLTKLNYLELAKTNDDIYILLVPNNQKLCAKDIKQQLHMLPKVLQDSIFSATTSPGYEPLENAEFCKLNYQCSDKNKELIGALCRYIELRCFGDEYKASFKLFGHQFNFGFSMDEKINATSALIEVLLGNKPIASLEQHQSTLSNGLLGRIISQQKGKNSIEHFIDSSQKVNSAHLTTSIKAELNLLKKNQDTESAQNSPSPPIKS